MWFQNCKAMWNQNFVKSQKLFIAKCNGEGIMILGKWMRVSATFFGDGLNLVKHFKLIATCMCSQQYQVNS